MFKFKTVELVVSAMIGVVTGLFLMIWSNLYMPLSPLLGPVGIEVLYGMYFIPAIITLCIMRKPGLGLLASVAGGIAELLAGSPFGINIIVAGIVQGLAAEIIFYIFKEKNSYGVCGIAGGFTAIAIFVRDFFVFGYSKNSIAIIIAMISIRIVSGIILGGFTSKFICSLLSNTGILNNFVNVDGSEIN